VTTAKQHAYSLDLKCLYCFDMGVDVVSDGLEVLELFLSVIDDGGVFEDGAVVSEIDGGGLRVVLDGETLCFGVTLTKSLKRGNSF
jgi:hypothetical protein